MATGRIPTTANSPLTAKGDLFTFSTGSAKLAVGNNGETLVADSSTSTGLRWQGDYAAGKNKIINGDFNINQRAFTSISGSGDYGFDRWQLGLSGATGTMTAQTFTPGTAPVAGYEAKNFARTTITTGNDFARIAQSIEDVRTFAGQTATISFWAKGTNPTTAGNLKVDLEQNFGSGGSPSATVVVTEQTFVLTANWTRYSLTFNVPSISGKTIGTTANTSYLSIRIGQGSSISTDAWTLDIWGVQAEAGSVATAFQTATGTIQGELAACQRYFTRIGGEVAYNFMASSYFDSATTGFGMVNYSSMRSTPAATFSTASNYAALNVGTAVTACTAISADFYNTKSFRLNFTVGSSRTSGQGCIITSNNTTNGFIDISAEL